MLRRSLLSATLTARPTIALRYAVRNAQTATADAAAAAPAATPEEIDARGMFVFFVLFCFVLFFVCVFALFVCALCLRSLDEAVSAKH